MFGIRQLFVDLGMRQESATPIFTDSQSALVVAHNLAFHARTKHIEVHYRYVRERFSTGEVSMTYVSTHNNVANIFTKALPHEKFEGFCKNLLPFGD